MGNHLGRFRGGILQLLDAPPPNLKNLIKCHRYASLWVMSEQVSTPRFRRFKFDGRRDFWWISIGQVAKTKYSYTPSWNLQFAPQKKKKIIFYTKGKICDPSNEYSGAMLVSWRVYKMVTNKKTSWWKTSHETFQRDQNITSSPDNKKIHWLSKEISKISSILMHFVRLIFLPV